MGVKSKIKKWFYIKLKNLLDYENTTPIEIKKSFNIKVGRKSYHNGNFTVKGSGHLDIGSFCAFGQDIKVILSNHNYNYPSIQYSFYNIYFNRLPYDKVVGKTVIGSDVWIGDNVVILPNVRIGNGVCIGAGSIVTKDIPDYAIVGGNPAKVIKYRFEDKVIKDLIELKWWDWDDKEIIKNKQFFFKSPFE